LGFIESADCDHSNGKHTTHHAAATRTERKALFSSVRRFISFQFGIFVGNVALEETICLIHWKGAFLAVDLLVKLSDLIPVRCGRGFVRSEADEIHRSGTLSFAPKSVRF
jgi:hypothetical protein